MEVPANRYDLLSVEGFSMALSSYLNIKEMPIYKLSKENTKIIVESNKVDKVRPFVVAGVLRNVTFN